MILTGEDLERLAVAMEKKVPEKSTLLPIFKRDADNVRGSAAVLLIGVSRDPKRMESPFNCGGCGNKTCKDFFGWWETRRGGFYRAYLCISSH